jgi:hypothetical protein
VLQRKADRDDPAELKMSPRLILELLHRRARLGGIGAIVVGFLLQAAALDKGQLLLVEPLLVLQLPLTLLLAGRVSHRDLHRRAWIELAAVSVGLTALVYCLHPRGGDRSGVSGLHRVLGIEVALGVVAVLMALGRGAHGNGRLDRPARGAAGALRTRGGGPSMTDARSAPPDVAELPPARGIDAGR